MGDGFMVSSSRFCGEAANYATGGELEHNMARSFVEVPSFLGLSRMDGPMLTYPQ